MLIPLLMRAMLIRLYEVETFNEQSFDYNMLHRTPITLLLLLYEFYLPHRNILKNLISSLKLLLSQYYMSLIY